MTGSRFRRATWAVRLAVLALCVFGASQPLMCRGLAAAAAQGAPPPLPPPPPPPPPPPRPAAPTTPVPLAPLPAGTSAIRGRVVDGTVPVGRALVRLAAAAGVRGRTSITDAQGRFTFDGLPDGRFTLTASKPAYITSAFGSTRPGRPGTAISVGRGQIIEDVAIQMPKGGVISGLITDVNGEPVPGLLVGYLRAAGSQPAAGDTYRSDWVTDDRGMYRIYGLDPGSYFVVAGSRSSPGTIPVATMPVGDVDVALAELQQRGARGRGAAPGPPAVVQFVGVYYPGTPDVGDAVPITVGAGDVRSDANIVYAPVSSASIEGVVTGSTGALPPVAMSLAPAVPSRLPPFLVATSSLTVRPGADGKFRYTGVAPGRYLLIARTQPAQDSPGMMVTTAMPGGGSSGRSRAPGAPDTPTPDALYGAMELTVAGTDVTGVALDLRPAPHLTGRIEFDSATGQRPSDPAAVRLSLGTTRAQTFVGSVAGTTNGSISFNGRDTRLAANVTPALTFDVAGVVPDAYAVSATVQGRPDWRLRSAIMHGRDVLDTGLTVVDGAAGELVLTFTDRHNELSGMLQTPAGAPATDYFVAVFTTDRTLWTPQARRLVFARPASDGRFSLKDLPAGEYYLAALTDLDPADWQTPAFLDPIVPAALRFTIADGEMKRQDLRLAQ